MKHPMQNQRGSALVLVTLLTLVLAALAIIALRNTARSVQQTATYQTRGQAGEMATSTGRLASKRVGDQAPKFWRRMTATMYGQSDDGDLGVLGTSGQTGTASQRLDTILLGPYATLTGDDFKEMFNGYGGTETGLFSDGTTPSFESRSGKESEVRFVIRDPIESNAAIGFGVNQAFCFKKVSMDAAAAVGDQDDDWTGANNIAQVRTGIEGLIGPIECAN